MKEPKLSKGLQYMDEDLIVEAMEENEIKKASSWNGWKGWGTVAAAIVLFIVSVCGINYFNIRNIYYGTGVNGYGEWWKDVVYLDAKIPMAEVENGYIIYELIPEGNIYNGNIFGKLYENSLLQRSCWPNFSHGTRVLFSRISDPLDTDKDRYKEVVSYIGDEKFCINLLKVAENYGSGDGMGCYLIQNGYDKETIAVALRVHMERLGESTFKLIMSEDFSRVENKDIRTEIEGLKEMDIDAMSVINNQKVCVKFVYNRKSTQNKEVAESYMYYAYWKQGDMEYLLQFDPGYTRGDMSSQVQENRRAVFEELIGEIVEMTS